MVPTKPAPAWRLPSPALSVYDFLPFCKRGKKRHKQILGLPLASPQAAAPLPKQGLCRHWRASVLGTAGSITESCLLVPFVPSVLPALPSASSVLPAAPLFLPLTLSSLHLLSFRPSACLCSHPSCSLCCSRLKHPSILMGVVCPACEDSDPFTQLWRSNSASRLSS